MKSLYYTLGRFKRFDKGGSISGTIAVNFTAAALSALTSIVFARLLGISNYGLYVYVISATGFMGSISKLGLPTLVVRQVAAWSATGEWQLFNGIIRFGILATLASSIFFGLILLACNSFLGSISATPDFLLALSLGIGIMVLQCMDSTVAGALQGMHFIARSLIPQSIALPACLIVFVIAAYVLHTRPTATMLLAAQFGLGVLAEAYQLFSLSRCRPALSLGKGHRTTAATWLRRSLPFWGNGILFIINIQADTLLIGYFKGSSSAAVYTVGTKGAQLLVLTLGAVVTAIQPRLAGFHNAGSHAEVRRVVTGTTRLGFLLAFAGTVFFFVFGGPLIRILYGPAFAGALAVLLILVLARLANASVGSLGPYLAMTGKEYLLLKALAVESVANVLLNVLLISRWGIDGSAFATGISMAGTNFVLAYYVYRRWGVDVSILGLKATSEAIPS